MIYYYSYSYYYPCGDHYKMFGQSRIEESQPEHDATLDPNELMQEMKKN
uniref:Uncharacterized protein n=1 Tax=Physcomitrium patens TaxID=3218 RepID=A0A2K1KHX4_PHYPA|nr:hypothetical protein PHYPA_007052 [Physcomitrium patens]